MLQEKDALTDETFNSLQQGTKVSFKWHGSDLLYEGRIEVDKRGDIYFVNEHNYNYFNLNGLCVKTYQSDIFNNWIHTEWLDGENGINAITAVSTAGDEFTIDSLNLAKKVYDMLNRIALSGGTYEDWQESKTLLTDTDIEKIIENLS